MGNIDYSLLGSLSLKETGLLSMASRELIQFLYNNEINTVSKFLECMDNNSFKITTYSDTMNEARGLADILKNKYFNTPLISSVFLGIPISELVFSLPAGDFNVLGIRENLKKSITIYTAIARLGFNDKERNKILPEYEKDLLGRTLIDIFQDIVSNDYYKSSSISEEDKVFYRKILFYVNYCQNKVDNMIRLDLMCKLDVLMKELEDLLGKKSELDIQIENVRSNIQIIEEGIRSIGK